MLLVLGVRMNNYIQRVPKIFAAGSVERIVFTLIIFCFLMAGCRSVPQFPKRPLRVQITSDGSKVLAFDTNKDRQADYWQREDANGRKVELRFAADKEQPGRVVQLDEVDADKVPHFIIALDGVPYRIVQELYGAGCFRLFYPPSRMVSTFPGMTDLAFQRIFGGKQPIAYQAKHFDRQKNKLFSGDDVYLSGQAADWSNGLNYRCSFKWDVVAYIFPDLVFEHELEGIVKEFSQMQEGTSIVYSVATAGLGTRGGREAIIKYLRTVDQLCEQIFYERRGQVQITLLADHGHHMSGRGRVSFKELLKENGYCLTDRLKESTDVVTVEYGLVTYAAYFTADPAGVAKVLLQDQVTTIACYPQKDAVVLRSIDGMALLRHENGRYSYDVKKGDPLQLKNIIEQLRQQGKIDKDGFIDDQALFDATIKHIYPDPLRRIWLAFNGMVQKPADLIVCLKDGWVHGSKFFEVMIGGATSTHGSLNQINSVTFALTTMGSLPEAMRLEEIMPALKMLQTNN